MWIGMKVPSCVQRMAAHPCSCWLAQHVTHMPLCHSWHQSGAKESQGRPHHSPPLLVGSWGEVVSASAPREQQ